MLSTTTQKYGPKAGIKIKISMENTVQQTEPSHLKENRQYPNNKTQN
jgi:hypothetical protein